ncbi:MAG: hypothetical protein ACLFQQ_23820, partial [Desulfococcaceae bacterium]
LGCFSGMRQGIHPLAAKTVCSFKQIASNCSGRMDWWTHLVSDIEKTFGDYYKSSQTEKNNIGIGKEIPPTF